MNKKGIIGPNPGDWILTAVAWTIIIIILAAIFMGGIFTGKKLGREEMINELPIDRVLVENFSFYQNDTYIEVSFDKLDVDTKS